ncbi:hypothetical protein SEA_YAGO84_78 [Gordonia phage Yago84]|nr:hypothetical protein SEA_YAGO84_78 [Gordonia phage Yago84]QIG59003.1 hypothetical protein SEA_ANCLAR_76 [Gordonia phage AnClar]WIC90061.1 hypothetical protein SEA_SISKO_79 [Gordonia phage Sisko]
MTEIAIVTKFQTNSAEIEAPELTAGHLLEAQEQVGTQITWTDIQADCAKGRYTDGSGKEHRIAVADLGVLSAREALDLASWVNGIIA